MPQTTQDKRGVWTFQGGKWGASDSSEESYIFYDDFSSGDLSKTEGGFSWGAATNLSVISGFSRAGNVGNCVRFNFDIAAEAVSELRFSLGSSYPEIWFKYYLYYPDGTETPFRGVKMEQFGNNNKFMRVWSEESGSETDPRMGVSYYADGLSGNVRAGLQSGVFNNGTVSQVPYDDANYIDLVTDQTRGKWVEIVHYYKASTTDVGSTPSEGDGVIKLWVDGNVVEAVNLNARATDGIYGFTHGYLQGAQDSPWAGTEGRAIYMSDFYVSTEPLIK